MKKPDFTRSFPAAIHFPILTGEAKLDTAPLDTVRTGFQQYKNRESGDFRERKWRDVCGGGWFSYKVGIDPAKRDGASVRLLRRWPAVCSLRR